MANSLHLNSAIRKFQQTDDASKMNIYFDLQSIRFILHVVLSKLISIFANAQIDKKQSIKIHFAIFNCNFKQALSILQSPDRPLGIGQQQCFELASCNYVSTIDPS